MASLARELRKNLEKTVKQARSVAEAGARKVLEQHGVHHHEPYGSMTLEQRALRNRLRAHGRQLGDRRDSQKGTQTIGQLVQECAYEHWHRMLFARFLAESDLLIEPQSGVAITLAECRELAHDEGADWLSLASDYAEGMLPQIFRKDAPVLAVILPPETRSELEDLLKALPRSVFTADDSLGWVYQFWQADAKETVNKSGKKIGADELPAVTQLFTEDYMVLFLLHNTLGAWWAGKVLKERPELATSAKDEDELRAACNIGDVEWTYVRFLRDKTEDGTEGLWRPAAGTFDQWPRAAKDLTVLDPCMGSGHFLVFALPMLVAFRANEEGLNRENAIEAVLRENLFGLEIDQRCTQIGAFNLSFAAWRMVGYRPLPKLNLACSGLAIGVSKTEWLRLAEKAVAAADPDAKRDLLGTEENLLTAGLEARIRNGLEGLFDLFVKAPSLGSLIGPHSTRGDIFNADFAQMEPLLGAILSAAESDDLAEMTVAAQGMAEAAKYLSQRFTLVATNVPYLGREGHADEISAYAQSHAPHAATDLATLFLHRFGGLVRGGTCCAVTPQNWWVGTAYRDFRKEFIESTDWRMAAVLGEEAWYTYGNRGPNTILLIANYHSRGNTFVAIDVSTKPRMEVVNIEIKKKALQGAWSNEYLSTLSKVHEIRQNDILKNRDFRVSISGSYSKNRLDLLVQSGEGSSTGDNDRFLRCFWEVNNNNDWISYCGPGQRNEIYCDTSLVVFWENGNGELSRSSKARIQNTNLWQRPGVLVGRVRGITATLFESGCFSKGAVLICPESSNDFPAIFAFLKSGDYEQAVRSLDPRVSAATSVLTDVPFEMEQWTEVARNSWPQGIPKPTSKDPTQRIFGGNPIASNSALHVAVPLLLGYFWPKQFITAEGNARSDPREGTKQHTDDDGIVCLSALKGEAPAEQCLNALLAEAFGTDWLAAKLASLLAEAGFAGKSLDDWLRDGFFEQHCTLFQNRPFIWHIWDGRRDGFQALVNYHRLATPGGEGRRTLEKLIYSYLGDWIDRQRSDQKAGIEGADGRLAAAEQLRSELTKILVGEPPYDIFVRWKPLFQQPIGWEPDINDGVRMNIRPFMTARPLGERAKTACILRTTPKSLKWDKDRGKESTREKEDYPWFWGWDAEDAACAIDFAGGPKFDGNRWNEPHYTRAFKEAARVRQSAKVGAKT